jgi:hypothetical protein
LDSHPRRRIYLCRFGTTGRFPDVGVNVTTGPHLGTVGDDPAESRLRVVLERRGFSIHPAAALFPMLGDSDLSDLARDIEKNGLRQPIAIWRSLPGASWQVIDGRNRVVAMLQLPDGERLLAGALATANQYENDTDPIGFVISANAHRRHLTAEQKRGLIAELLKANPERSNRATAAIARADDKTVAVVRGTMESTAVIPQLTKTVGADGKARTTTPAPRPRREPEYTAILPPIRHEQSEPALTPAPNPAPQLQPIDVPAWEKRTRDVRLLLPAFLTLDPPAGFNHVAKVLSRITFADTFDRKQRIAAARQLITALGLSPADLRLF